MHVYVKFNNRQIQMENLKSATKLDIVYDKLFSFILCVDNKNNE